MAGLTEVECGTQTEVRAVEGIQAETRAESLERYKQVYKYLAKGRYPRHLTALQKRSLRRYATKFEVEDFLKAVTAENTWPLKQTTLQFVKPPVNSTVL
ncbi:actin-related protein T2 [Platysternon megacephalum]|uniref:Actin-related protein T2 n=1 Tax=Platysternon megacephalum TaxID=55544 RepID=A0A4D9F3Y4_9SAUR|nr:actin-related protein T2 [Platysternon megacephalum]